MKKLLPLLLCILLLTGCATVYDGPTMAVSVLSYEETNYVDTSGEVYQRHRTEYAYDIYGNRSQAIEYDNDEPSLKTVQRYDEAGRVVRLTQYDVTGWLPRKIADNRYTYDGQGRMTSSTHSEEEDVTIHYDDEARTRTTVCGDSTTVEYLDEQGWVIRIEYPGTDLTEEFDRRADGGWTAIRSYRSGVLESTTERTFDDQGRPILWTETENGETATVFRWEYGENWESQIQADGSKTTTCCHDDGTVHIRYFTDADGFIYKEVYYRYTDIQVPAGREETP